MNFKIHLLSSFMAFIQRKFNILFYSVSNLNLTVFVVDTVLVINHEFCFYLLFNLRHYKSILFVCFGCFTLLGLSICCRCQYGGNNVTSKADSGPPERKHFVAYNILLFQLTQPTSCCHN